jgi:hypothetical protein
MATKKTMTPRELEAGLAPGGGFATAARFPVCQGEPR